MTTLAEFLLARITEDEERARGSHRVEGWYLEQRGDWREDRGSTLIGGGKPLAHFDVEHGAMAAFHVVAWNPERVLAECEAKRRIVKQWQSVAAYIKVRQSERMPCDAIQRDNRVRYESLSELARVYADHPDYRQEWKP